MGGTSAARDRFEQSTNLRRMPCAKLIVSLAASAVMAAAVVAGNSQVSVISGTLTQP